MAERCVSQCLCANAPNLPNPQAMGQGLPKTERRDLSTAGSLAAIPAIIFAAATESTSSPPTKNHRITSGSNTACSKQQSDYCWGTSGSGCSQFSTEGDNPGIYLFRITDLLSEMDEKTEENTGITAVLTEASFSQLYRHYLERMGILQSSYRIQKQPGGTVALPVLEEKLTESILMELQESVAPGSTCSVIQIKNPVFSKRARVQSPGQEMRCELHSLVERYGITWNRELERDLPYSWQIHGDLVLLSENCFRAPMWKELGPDLWQTVATTLGAQRLAKRGHISTDGFRSPTVTLLLGNDNWVEHEDNGIRYTFDVTRCMFSSGNISEKLRLASLDCSGEVIVDLYAGIGYFTLPFLVHAGAAFVHACEWNPHAVEALKKNLVLNGVSDRCRIYEGDNKKLDLKNVADRVNLGLIPTSREGWPIACKVLRQDKGGILHIHQNVESFQGKGHMYASSQEQNQYEQQVFSKGKVGSITLKEDQFDQSASMCTPERVPDTSEMTLKPEWHIWAQSAEKEIVMLLNELEENRWKTKILHIEHVKSYAPHVDHIVLDLDCRPISK